MARIETGAPTTEALGAIVLTAVRDVLGNQSIAPTDNFFEAGGDSLLGLQVLTRIEEATGVELPVSALFTHPSPGELTSVLGERPWPD